jgi:hypothetical protein
MRMIVAALAFVVVVVGVASANDKSATADANKKAAEKLKALKPFTGKLVISPDAPPASSDELPGYLKGNLSPDGAYELIKGPPWPFHITLVLATATRTVTLVVMDKADAKATPLLTATIAPAGDRKLVLAHAEATIAAGFAAHKTYEVRLLAGKKVLAKAELLLRD